MEYQNLRTVALDCEWGASRIVFAQHPNHAKEGRAAAAVEGPGREQDGFVQRALSAADGEVSRLSRRPPARRRRPSAPVPPGRPPLTCPLRRPSPVMALGTAPPFTAVARLEKVLESEAPETIPEGDTWVLGRVAFRRLSEGRVPLCGSLRQVLLSRRV